MTVSTQWKSGYSAGCGVMLIAIGLLLFVLKSFSPLGFGTALMAGLGFLFTSHWLEETHGH